MPTLEWIGKDKVVTRYLDVPYHVLNRQYSFDENGKSSDDNSSENMIIHGDNLTALKSLLPILIRHITLEMRDGFTTTMLMIRG